MLTLGSLSVGTVFRIVQDGETLDEMKVIRSGHGGAREWPEIEAESLKANPGARTEFTFIPKENEFFAQEGWRRLGEDPMTGERCFSQRPPRYTLESV